MQLKSIGLAAIAAYIMVFAASAQSDNGNIEPTKQSDATKLVFSSLELDQTNRGSININGYDRHFSVTFPTSYDNSVAYPVVLFFHGCMCRPSHTEEIIKSYLDWKPRLDFV
jgi:poly(3-hydroxybutyrate) depolymerase